MNIVVDENITFAGEAFSELGSVKLLEGRSITNVLLKDTDILIVRSVTKVDKNLLNNTNVKFVGTATTGTDHIDTDYLIRHKIVYTDAAGCNADAVAEYVFTALLKIATDEEISLSGKTIGIVGIGKIGGRVLRLAETLGLNVLKNDPPKERAGIGSGYVTLDEILNTDIITVHVPLNKKGIDKTVHLFNQENLKRIKKGTIIINTARGEVIDNKALLVETNKKNFKLVLDVWENEPDINIELLNITQIGTPHIAGYSWEGKVNGTKMIYDALCKFLGMQPAWQPALKSVDDPVISLPIGRTSEEKLYALYSSVYNIERDDESLRNLFNLSKEERIIRFDKLRKEYPVRREFCNYSVKLSPEYFMIKPILEAFRFQAVV